MYSALKMGYTVRHPTVDDIAAIIAVMRDFDIAEADEVDVYHTEDILADWEDLDISKDAWVVLAPDGMLCGYATLTDQEDGYIVSDGYVHPLHYGRGIGTTLIELMEARAAELVADIQEGTRQVLVNNIITSACISLWMPHLSHRSGRRVLLCGHVMVARRISTAPTKQLKTVFRITGRTRHAVSRTGDDTCCAKILIQRCGSWHRTGSRSRERYFAGYARPGVGGLSR